jgi:uncharacterized repeat protein (TIGR03803 family)
MTNMHSRVGFVLFSLWIASIVSPAQVFTSLTSFNGQNGGDPLVISLIQGPDGAFYGTTELGSNFASCPLYGCGTIFRITSAGSLTHLPLTPLDGEYPEAGLLLASNGNFYGVATYGGTNTDGCYEFSCGTVFEVSPSGSLTLLYSFCSQQGCVDGLYPEAALIQATDGNFYGTTLEGGGPSYGGTAFKITANGILTTLYSFCTQTDCADGIEPAASLVEGTDGNFYGSTELGGDYTSCPGSGCGTVFKMTPFGVLTTLHRFGATEGWDIHGLIQAGDGNFYGTSFIGGDLTCDPPYGCGTIFRITPAGKVTVLHRFEETDGIGPFAPLVLANDGNLYGATSGEKNPGTYSAGTVFKLTAQGVLTTLHAFDGTDGSDAAGGLLQATDGKLYGTTVYGGQLSCKLDSRIGCGTVYSLDMGLAPFVAFVHAAGKVGQIGGVLGQGFTGTTAVSLNGTPMTFNVVSDTYLTATVPPGATTGFATVTTPTGVLTSNVPFRVIP